MKNSLRVARNSLWLVVQPFALAMLSIFVTALVARELGTKGYGTLLLLLSYSILLPTLCDFGLRAYSVRAVAADRTNVLAFVEEMVWLRLCLSLLSIIIASLIVPLIHLEVSRTMIFLISVQMLVNAVASCFMDAFYGLEKMRCAAITLGAAGTIVQVASILAVWLHLDTVGVTAAYALGSVGLLGISWLFFLREVGRTNFTLTNFELAKHFKLSWLFYLQNVVTTIRSRLDLILVGSLLSTREAGLFGSAQSLVHRLDVIQDGMSTAIFPRVTELHKDAEDDMRALVRSAMKMSLLVSTPIALGALAVSDDIVLLVFGKQFADSGKLFAVFGLGMPFLFVQSLIGHVLSAMGKQFSVFYCCVIAAVASVAMLLTGLSLFGSLGGAIASVLSLMTLAILFVFVYWRHHGSPFVTRDLLAIAAANSLLGLFLWLTTDLHVLIRVVVGATTYVAASFTLALVRVDMVRAILSRKS